MEFAPERNLVRQVDNDALYALFHRLEFTRLMSRYNLHAPQEKAAPQKTTDVVVMCESVTDASQAREIAAKLTKERYVNLMTEPDLSGIAVDTEDTSYLFSGDAVQDNDFMSTLFSASIKKVTHDCKPLMARTAGKRTPCRRLYLRHSAGCI